MNRVERNNSSAFQEKKKIVYIYLIHIYCVLTIKALYGLPFLRYDGKGEKQGSSKIWNEHGHIKPEVSKCESWYYGVWGNRREELIFISRNE